MAIGPAPYLFNNSAAGRISKVVKTVEAMGRDNKDKHVPQGFSGQTIIARLTNKVTDGWEWEEVYRHKDTSGNYTWVTASKRGTDTPATDENKCLAVEAIKGSAAPQEIVVLQKLYTEVAVASAGDNPIPQTDYLIVGPIAAVIFVKCINDNSHSGTVSCKQADSTSLGTFGDAFDVTAQYHTSTGNYFWVGSNGTTYTQLGFPSQRSQFMCLQIMDNAASPQSIDWDYPKGH
jgi:hypothetical protein